MADTMEMVEKLLFVFSQLSDEQKEVAVVIAACLADGRDDEAQRLAEGGRQ